MAYVPPQYNGPVPFQPYQPYPQPYQPYPQPKPENVKPGKRKLTDRIKEHRVTSFYGIVSIIGASCKAISCVLDGEAPPANDVYLIFTGIGLLFASDSKSTE